MLRVGFWYEVKERRGAPVFHRQPHAAVGAAPDWPAWCALARPSPPAQATLATTLGTLNACFSEEGFQWPEMRRREIGSDGLQAILMLDVANTSTWAAVLGKHHARLCMRASLVGGAAGRRAPTLDTRMRPCATATPLAPPGLALTQRRCDPRRCAAADIGLVASAALGQVVAFGRMHFEEHIEGCTQCIQGFVKTLGAPACLPASCLPACLHVV